jgi:integrase
MPAEQRGSTYRTSTGCGIRWTDETGRRRRQAGFSSPSKARTWFRDVELVRMRGGLIDEALTLREFSDRYLARYEVDRAAVTVQTLKWRLVRPLDEFGDVKLSELRAGEIAAWEATLPPRFRYAVVRALRQVLDAAVAWEYLARNPAKATGKNTKPTILERIALEPAEVDKLAGEVHSQCAAAIIVGAWCYLRPSELQALERGAWRGDCSKFGGHSTAKAERSLRARHAAV